MNPTERSAIMLNAYGSMYPNALSTYERIKKFYGQQFPESEIVLAFTSKFIRLRLKDREILVHNPMTALAELHDTGYRDVLIQSLQIVPGREFHDVSSLIAGLQSVYGKFGFGRLMIGLPLLAGLDDCGSDIRFPFFARLAGFDLYLDTGVQCEHVLNYPLSPNDFIGQSAANLRDLTLKILQDSYQESQRIEQAKAAL